MWVISHWYFLSVTLGLFNSSVVLDVAPQGWIVRYSDFRAAPARWEVTTTPSSDHVKFVNHAFGDESRVGRSMVHDSHTRRFGGLNFLRNGFMRIVAIRHWLVVALLAACHVVLHFIYPKPAASN